MGKERRGEGIQNPSRPDSDAAGGKPKKCPGAQGRKRGTSTPECEERLRKEKKEEAR